MLLIFFGLDTYLYSKEPSYETNDSENEKLSIEGSFNLLLLAGVVGGVLISGFWKSGVEIPIYHFAVKLENIVRDVLLLSLTYASWTLTPKTIREANEYTWFPIEEVGKLFAGIFVTIIPAIAILRAGLEGNLDWVIKLVTENENPNFMYFWMTGILSSFLDNAPTYIVFFETAGGNPVELMGLKYKTLLAISMGAVFMGANSYIGNAPNFMVKSIAESSNIKMPSFFGYILKWSLPILFPLFAIASWIFF